MSKPVTPVEFARFKALSKNRHVSRSRPSKPLRCTRGHDLHLPYAAIYCRGQGVAGHWICRKCRDERTEARKGTVKKTYTSQSATISEAEFTSQYLALGLKLEQAATHWERDTIRGQMEALQRRHSGKAVRQ